MLSLLSDLLVIEENQRSSKPQQYHRSADWYYLEDNKSNVRFYYNYPRITSAYLEYM